MVTEKDTGTEPLLISVSEAARRLGLGIDSTYELVRSGRLASVPVGRRNRKVPVVALEDYIAREIARGAV